MHLHLHSSSHLLSSFNFILYLYDSICFCLHCFLYASVSVLMFIPLSVLVSACLYMLLIFGVCLNSDLVITLDPPLHLLYDETHWKHMSFGDSL